MLTPQQRTIRQNVRNFAVGLTREEVAAAIRISIEMNEEYRAKFFQEWLDELDEEGE